MTSFKSGYYYNTWNCDYNYLKKKNRRNLIINFLIRYEIVHGAAVLF